MHMLIEYILDECFSDCGHSTKLLKMRIVHLIAWSILPSCSGHGFPLKAAVFLPDEEHCHDCTGYRGTIQKVIPALDLAVNDSSARFFGGETWLELVPYPTNGCGSPKVVAHTVLKAVENGVRR